MEWQAVLQGNVTGTPWSSPLLLTRSDPYLVWFDILHRQPEQQWVDLLIELPLDLVSRKSAVTWLLHPNIAFDFRFPASPHRRGSPFQFATGMLRIDRVRLLVEQVAKRGHVLRLQMASPRIADGGGPVADSNWKALNNRRDRYLKFLLGPEKLGKRTAPPVIMVVDDRCNFAHADLRDQVQTIWHQGRRIPSAASRNARSAASADSAPAAGASADPWQYFQPDRRTGQESKTADKAAVPGGPTSPFPPVEMDEIGVEHYGATLAVQRMAPPRGVHDETAYYRRARYLQNAPRWSHGSAVMSAIAGRHPATKGSLICRPGPDEKKHVHFVQLPALTVLDTSGISLASYALDAIHRAVRHASHGPGNTSSPFVIVNISYGTNSGPHDGSSMFEQAMLELLDHYDGADNGPVLHIVLPSGNMHLARCHASGWLARRGVAEAERTLHWKVLPDDDTESFVELWFDKGAQVDVRIVAPDGGASQWFEPGAACHWTEAGVLRAALIYPPSTALGDKGTVALLAVAPTRRRAVGVGSPLRATKAQLDDADSASADSFERVFSQAPAGVWRIELRNRSSTEAASFHAWVQRDDAAPARSRSLLGFAGRQSHFLDGDGSVDPRGSLNGIATADRPDRRRLWVVGAMDEEGRIPLYSGAGPARGTALRIDGPNIAITVDHSRSLPGSLLGGTLSPSKLRVSGTSIAAAHFTRMLHDVLLKMGPDGLQAWVRPIDSARPYMQAAGDAEAAPDVYRGAINRLGGTDDVAGC